MEPMEPMESMDPKFSQVNNAIECLQHLFHSINHSSLQLHQVKTQLDTIDPILENIETNLVKNSELKYLQSLISPQTTTSWNQWLDSSTPDNPIILIRLRNLMSTYFKLVDAVENEDWKKVLHLLAYRDKIQLENSVRQFFPNSGLLNKSSLEPTVELISGLILAIEKEEEQLVIKLLHKLEHKSSLANNLHIFGILQKLVPFKDHPHLLKRLLLVSQDLKFQQSMSKVLHFQAGDVNKFLLSLFSKFSTECNDVVSQYQLIFLNSSSSVLESYDFDDTLETWLLSKISVFIGLVEKYIPQLVLSTDIFSLFSQYTFLNTRFSQWGLDLSHQIMPIFSKTLVSFLFKHAGISGLDGISLELSNQLSLYKKRIESLDLSKNITENQVSSLWSYIWKSTDDDLSISETPEDSSQKITQDSVEKSSKSQISTIPLPKNIHSCPILFEWTQKVLTCFNEIRTIVFVDSIPTLLIHIEKFLVTCKNIWQETCFHFSELVSTQFPSLDHEIQTASKFFSAQLIPYLVGQLSLLLGIDLYHLSIGISSFSNVNGNSSLPNFIPENAIVTPKPKPKPTTTTTTTTTTE